MKKYRPIAYKVKGCKANIYSVNRETKHDCVLEDFGRDPLKIFK